MVWKRQSSVWIWVIAPVIVAVVLFALFALRGNQATAGGPVSDLRSAPALTTMV